MDADLEKELRTEIAQQADEILRLQSEVERLIARQGNRIEATREVDPLEGGLFALPDEFND